MKKIIIFSFLLTFLFFGFQKNVKAYSDYQVTTDDLQDAISYYKNLNSIYTAFNYNVSNFNKTDIDSALDKLNLNSVITEINSNLQYIHLSDRGYITSSVKKNNISFILSAGGFNGSSDRFSIIILISANQDDNTNEIGFIEVENLNNYTIIKNYNNNTKQSWFSVEISITDGTMITSSFPRSLSDFNLNINPQVDIFHNNKLNLEFLYSLEDTVVFYNGVSYVTSSNSSDNGSESGDNLYFNYDYNEYFIKPYVQITNADGLAQIYVDSYGIPFGVFTQSGDEYYPFESLKLNLVVYEVEKGSGDFDFVNASVINSYKLYSGDYADTSGFSATYNNGNIIQYEYDLTNKFESSFVDQYINPAGEVNYAFKIFLYDFWGEKISSTKYFYFNEKNPLNNFTISNDYYNDNFNLNNISTDFSSLVNTFREFMSTIMSFMAFLPAWLIALITLGVTAAIAIRILGR